MGENDKKIILNIGCGFRHMEEAINVDAFENCKPDVLWNLNNFPWPWADNSIDMIYAIHVMEHLEDWWPAFLECVRILKPGGVFEMYVPDYTSVEDMGYIDHHHIICRLSFHLILNERQRGTNAWARTQNIVPVKMTRYLRMPHPHLVKWWMPKRLLRFCCDHMVNFVHEQRFTFIKTDRG